MATASDLLREAIDEPGLYLDQPTDTAAYAIDWTGKFAGTTPLVVRPRNTETVSRVLAACDRHGLAVVPQGGNTGIVGGSVPHQGEVVISLSRMNAIEAFDAASATATVQAGVVLQALQEHLAERDHEFAVDLAARGSCQIGGMIATNAGGIKVLRYGHMREQVRGLEVVLADGTVLRNLNRLKKNNTGLDLKQLFIGSEGILGVITRAVVQVQPRAPARQTALIGLADRAKLPALLQACRERFRGLSSLEFVVRDAIDLVREVEPETREPFGAIYQVYVIIEEETPAGAAAREGFVAALAALAEVELVADAIVAASERQARAVWRLREGPTELIGRLGLTHKFDVTVPPGAIPPFLTAMERLGEAMTGFRPLLYGHLGDGNVHVNMMQRPGLAEAAFHQAGPALAARIYGLVAEHEGSISAEHGIGVMKRDYLHLSRTAEEIALMRRLKATLDPNGILNPGVIFTA